MAIFRKSLLGLTTACVVSGGTVAQLSAQTSQELLNQAFQFVMQGQKNKALAPLEKILAKDPSQAQALELYSKVSKDIWYELVLTEGEVGKIAKTLMGKAQAEAKKLSTDEAAIEKLVADATGKEYEKRAAAIIALQSNHGEYAVPALAAKLGDADDDMGSAHAIWALHKLGSRATLPLIEAAQSKNAVLRQNIAAVFNFTQDYRSIPTLALLANDENAGVADVAKTALAKMQKKGASSDKVDLLLQQSQDYLTGLGTQGMDLSDVVWTFADGKLTYKPCDRAVYTFELAKKSAEKALAMDPTNAQATTLVARSYLAQCSAIQSAQIESLEGVKGNLNMVAMAMGPTVLDNALKQSIRDRQPLVAVAAIEALSSVVNPDKISETALLSSLDSTNKMVAYAAALGVARASRASTVPMADKVVRLLANGAQEQKLTRVASVGFAGNSLKDIQAMSNDKAGVVVEANYQTKHALLGQVLAGAIRPDAIVVNNNLSDGTPMDVISLLRDNPRTKDIKIFIAGGSEEAYGDKAKIVDANFKSSELRGQVQDSLKDITDEIGKRAAKVAADASQALLGLASNRVDISAAAGSLASELTREDAVAIPIAKALGEGGKDIAPLVAAIAGSGSDELKVAAAESIGKIFGRSGAIAADQFAALKKIAADGSANAALRTAVNGALGKADLEPAQKLELLKALSTAAVAGN